MTRSRKDLSFVGVQLLLFLAYLFRIPAIDFSLHKGLQWFGLGFTVLGFFIAVGSVFALRKSLSVFPSPKVHAELIESGVYRFIRHPIYTGILFTTAGYAVYSGNGLRFLVFLALCALFWFKASYEEKLLSKKFANYERYKTKAGMFLPRF